jgi:hypothetical protein
MLLLLLLLLPPSQLLPSLLTTAPWHLVHSVPLHLLQSLLPPLLAAATPSLLLLLLLLTSLLLRSLLPPLVTGHPLLLALRTCLQLLRVVRSHQFCLACLQTNTTVLPLLLRLSLPQHCLQLWAAGRWRGQAEPLACPRALSEVGDCRQVAVQLHGGNDERL